MFQDASAASVRPARRPTRGSGLGGLTDALPAGDGVDPDEEVPDEHAENPNSPSTSSAALRRAIHGNVIDWIMTETLRSHVTELE
jgi:hypothetical protein